MARAGTGARSERARAPRAWRTEKPSVLLSTDKNFWYLLSRLPFLPAKVAVFLAAVLACRGAPSRSRSGAAVGARAGAASSEPDSESAAAREQGARHAGAGSESRPRQASRGARAARPREWPPSLRVALCWGGGRNSMCFYRGRNQTPPNTNTNTRLGYNPQRAPAAAAARPLVAECSCRGVLTARASGSRLRLL